MQGLSLASIQNFVRADGTQRRVLISGIIAQARQDVRKRQWQLLVRRGTPVARTAGREQFLVTVGEDAISRTLFVYGECDYDNVEKAHRLLGRGQGSRRLMDVGANLGSICIPAVARGAAQSVVAIEPEPLNHSLLTINVRMNNLQDRITLVQAAAGDGESEDLALLLNEENRGDHQVVIAGSDPSGNSVVHVPSVTLDSVGRDFVAETDLIWMDIQGFEGHALKGARALVSRRVPMVMELWPEALLRQGTSATDLLTLLTPYSVWFDLSLNEPEACPLPEIMTLVEELLDPTRPRYYVDILLV